MHKSLLSILFLLLFGLVGIPHGWADHLTTRPGEERKIFHGKYDVPQNQTRRITTGWGVSLRTGGSFYHDDVISSVEGDPGVLVNGQVFYHIDRSWILGMSVEWERHQTSAAGIDLGTAQTISLLPYAEFHLPFFPWEAVSPYISLAAGLNINSYELDGSVAAACAALGFGSCDVEPENTFAFKGGIGTDIFITDNLAINAEGAWKLNSGDGKITVGGATVSQGDFEASVAQVILGVRWFFDQWP